MEVSTRIIFKSAQQYHAACNRLASAPTQEEAFQFGYPMVFLAVMASELYLKCMVYRLHRIVPHHHMLEKLFNSLSADIKAKIVARWDEFATPKFTQQIEWATRNFPHKVDTSFVGALRGASKANEELRYIWEGRPETYTLLHPLPGILQDVILKDLGGETWLEWDQPPPKAPSR